MDYGMIGKIEKAKRYAQERNRFHFKSMQVVVDGDNNAHTVTYDHGVWQCDCTFLPRAAAACIPWRLETILEGMLNGLPVES